MPNKLFLFFLIFSFARMVKFYGFCYSSVFFFFCDRGLVSRKHLICAWSCGERVFIFLTLHFYSITTNFRCCFNLWVCRRKARLMPLFADECMKFYLTRIVCQIIWNKYFYKMRNGPFVESFCLFFRHHLDGGWCVRPHHKHFCSLLHLCNYGRVVNSVAKYQQPTTMTTTWKKNQMK